MRNPSGALLLIIHRWLKLVGILVTAVMRMAAAAAAADRERRLQLARQRPPQLQLRLQRRRLARRPSRYCHCLSLHLVGMWLQAMQRVQCVCGGRWRRYHRRRRQLQRRRLRNRQQQSCQQQRVIMRVWRMVMLPHSLLRCQLQCRCRNRSRSRSRRLPPRHQLLLLVLLPVERQALLHLCRRTRGRHRHCTRCMVC